MMYENAIGLIGNTPLVRIRADPGSAGIFGKLESRNPGGSVKDRIALGMVREAEKSGKLKEKGTIVEPTSGNTGIGLAMIGATLGYRVILTMPETMSLERRQILLAYGAELVLTPGTLGMKGAIEKAREISAELGAFMPQQFENPANPLAHEETTYREIVSEFIPDAFVAGIGTGGTITGVGRKLKETGPGTLVIGVEPDASAVLSGEAPGPHKIQGIGAGFVPKILDRTVIDRIVRVRNEDAVSEARALPKTDGILAGISSGAALFAARQVARELGEGKRIVVLLPDTGERYLSTGVFG